jgi:hypothetical protein
MKKVVFLFLIVLSFISFSCDKYEPTKPESKFVNVELHAYSADLYVSGTVEVRLYSASVEFNEVLT